MPPFILSVRAREKKLDTSERLTYDEGHAFRGKRFAPLDDGLPALIVPFLIKAINVHAAIVVSA